VKLKELVSRLKTAELSGDPETEVFSVVYDSRTVRPGALFAAVCGLADDGRRFIPQAVAAGASAVLVDAPLAADPGVPVVSVPDVRRAMALAAAELLGRPAEQMTMIGVTGTNGKTTTAFLIESILDQAGLSVGVLGTVSVRFAGQVKPAAMTTPESPDLQGILREMLEAGVDHVVMEASSHALDQSRVAGCRYDVAVFTNLSQDHLDYHHDLSAYFEAKKRLFTEYLNGNRLTGGPKAVINVDDPRGRELAALLGSKALTFGLEEKADLQAVDVRADRTGLSALVVTPSGDFPVRSRLLGGLNLYNFLAAAGVGLILGLNHHAIAAGLTGLTGVPGRLERVGTRDDYLVLVDYAHTEDALARVLEAVRALGPRRLLIVFGCGGDRDRTKRPLMGRAAGRLADLAIITSDNPRTEDPLSIINQIETGLEGLGLTKLDPARINGLFPRGAYTVVPDRRAAIRLGVRLLQPGDILLLAGKGHEDYQILGREKIHFDDREEARAALAAEGKS